MASKKNVRKRSSTESTLIPESSRESPSSHGKGEGSVFDNERRDSATQSIMNLTMAIGGGVGGLAKEGTYVRTIFAVNLF